MKKFTPTPEMLKAAEAVFLAKAAVATIEPVVRGYQIEILTRYGFTNKHDFEMRDRSSSTRWHDLQVEIISDPEDTYRLSQDDFAVYLAECKTARDAAGLHVENDDFCPLLVAKDLLTQAEHLLVDTMEPVSSISYRQIMRTSGAIENLKQLVDLCLRLLVPYVKVSL
jgi:hypothetical protein